jgi:hypothetical protein
MLEEAPSTTTRSSPDPPRWEGRATPWAGRSVWTAGFIRIVSSRAGPLAVDRNRTDREQHA